MGKVIVGKMASPHVAPPAMGSYPPLIRTSTQGDTVGVAGRGKVGCVWMHAQEATARRV